MKEISIEEQKQILFDALIYFDQFCRGKDILYSLGEGSLLGAIRHKGFIPWDDDIDILMTRDNFNKFLLLHTDGVYKAYHVNPDINYWNTVIRLSDTRTAVYFGESTNSIHGLWLGLTPVDNIPDDEIEWARMKKRIAKWVKRCRQKRGIVPYDGVFGGRLKRSIFKVRKIDWFDRHFMKVISAYNGQTTKRMSKLNIRYEPFVFPSAVFDGYTELEFEGRNFMAIKHYDEYLTQMYGDYMTLPPEKDRVVKHCFKAFYKE